MPAEATGAWWPSWSSKPVRRGDSVGGFDSRPPPQSGLSAAQGLTRGWAFETIASLAAPPPKQPQSRSRRAEHEPRVNAMPRGPKTNDGHLSGYVTTPSRPIPADDGAVDHARPCHLFTLLRSRARSPPHCEYRRARNCGHDRHGSRAREQHGLIVAVQRLHLPRCRWAPADSTRGCRDGMRRTAVASPPRSGRGVPPRPSFPSACPSPPARISCECSWSRTTSAGSILDATTAVTLKVKVSPSP